MSNKKNKLFSNKSLSRLLNFSAAFILISVICFFFFRVYQINDINNFKYSKTYDKINLIEISLDSIKNKTVINNDEFNLVFESKIGELNDKIIELNSVKNEIEEAKKENDTLMRLYLAIIGSVFAIVGFFGFKSIHDTRQSAVERAVYEAKNEAIKEAREASKTEAKIASTSEARDVAETTSKQVAEKKAIEISKSETIKYLTDEFPKQFRIQEEKYTSDFTEQLSKVSLEVDKIMNPEAYGYKSKNETKIEKELENLKLKYNELLDIINILKIKHLKND